MAYESIINIRPSQNNRSMLIQDPVIQERVTQKKTLKLSFLRIYVFRDLCVSPIG
jgi:Protein of unknown function (DUF5674)